MPSQATENYLKAIYKVSLRNPIVSMAELGNALRVTPASVTNMVKKLAESGYLHHQPYQGVTLTESGRMLALRIIRNHRVLELYLSKVLGLSWDEVDQEAEALEHLVSDRLIEAMDSALDYPKFDPHGSPIPNAQGVIPPTPQSRCLADLEAGEGGRILRVESATDEMLRYLGELELFPESSVEVLMRTPFGGPLMLRVGEKECALSPDLARTIFVREDA